MTTAIARKPAGVTARLRRQKAGRLKREEIANKDKVRDRDVTCRFPLCPCRYFNLFLEVSHREHKGMGGDPSGERSVPELMVLICNWRHKEDRFSIDKHGIRWEGLTDAGANGPIAWDIDLGVFSRGLLAHGWAELARETAIREWAPMLDSQRAILDSLGKMIADRFR